LFASGLGDRGTKMLFVDKVAVDRGWGNTDDTCQLPSAYGIKSPLTYTSKTGSDHRVRQVAMVILFRAHFVSLEPP
jgi:hypothetical protein